MRSLRSIVAAVTSVLLVAGTTFAQEPYPNRPVRMIIPFPPGGPADLIARVMAQKLSEEFGKQFYIENHAGAGGNLGTGLASRAPADGYSLLVNSQSMITNRTLYNSVPYDPDKDFAHVTRIATTPNLLIVHPSVPANTIKELVDLLRKSSDKYHSYAHPGMGTPSNLSGELFRMSQNLTLTSIPFGGGGPMVQSVLAGHTPIGFTSLAPAAAHIRAGTLRALAVLADKRLESLPDIPTMAEAGYPGQTGETPQGILVPTGTPKEIIDFLRSKVVKIIAMPDVKQRLAAIGFTPIGDTPAEFAAFFKAEDQRWGKVIRDANLKLQ